MAKRDKVVVEMKKVACGIDVRRQTGIPADKPSSRCLEPRCSFS